MRKPHHRYFFVLILISSISLTSPKIVFSHQALNEYLDMNLVQLMDIVITSVSKKEQQLSDAAAAIYVISAEDIRKSGATHIADALALAPGLQVAKISASKWSISSRGFAGYTSNKLLILIDGRSVYSPAYSGTFWDMQNVMIEDIDRIEVIRGPGGTLWGANAVNGVINIITKNSFDTADSLIRIGAGNQETINLAVRQGFNLNDTTSGRIYLTYDDRDSNSLYEGGDAGDSWQRMLTGFRFDTDTSAGRKLTIQGELYKTDEEQLFFPDWNPTPPYTAPVSSESEIQLTGAHLLGKYQQQNVSKDSLTIQSYIDYTDRVDDFHQHSYLTFDLESLYEKSISKQNTITLGAGYTILVSSFDETAQVSLPDSTDDVFNAFIQDELRFLENSLLFTLGVKWEHNDYTGSEWQPSARLLWKPNSQHAIWTAVSRAVRTPSRVERTSTILMEVFPLSPVTNGTISFAGNNNFDSEVIIAYEAGYRWQATEKLSFDIATFYNDYDKLQGFIEVTGLPDISLAFDNLVEGNSYGLEASIDWKVTDRLSFAATYSYIEMDFSLKNPAALSDFVEFLENVTPQHQASLRSTIHFRENWQANFWLRYVDEITCRSSEQLISTPIEIDDYWLFDTSITWKPNNSTEIMLVGQNLLESSTLQYSSEFNTKPTEIERSIYLKFTYRF